LARSRNLARYPVLSYRDGQRFFLSGSRRPVPFCLLPDRQTAARATSSLPQVFPTCVRGIVAWPIDVDTGVHLPLPRVFPYSRRAAWSLLFLVGAHDPSIRTRDVTSHELDNTRPRPGYTNMGDEEKSRVSGEAPRAQNAPILPTVAPTSEKTPSSKQSSIHPAVYVLYDTLPQIRGRRLVC